MSAGLNPETKRGPIAWMAGHPVAANLVMLICLIGGFLSLRGTRQEVFPDIAPDTVSVAVAYPGASPEEVESGILLSIEEAIRNLEGVDETTSLAREGSGSVSVELLAGADVQRAAQEIKSEVDRIRTFPEDAEEPEVRVDQHRRDVLTVVLYGDAPDTVLHQLGEKLRDWLLQSPDITQVDLEGLPPLEIGIEIPREQLRRYGITLGEVANRLESSAADIPGGGMKTESGEVLVRLKERREYGRQFADLPVITTSDGSEVRLSRIAAIDDSFAETDRYSLYNGKKAVMLDVYRVGDETPIRVADAVRRELAAYKPYLPPGINTGINHDRSDIYRQRVELLLRNGAVGLVLVLCLLGLFLEARLAFWVMMGIPISFMGSFLFLPSMDVTVNMISLFAYIVALGIVVDDAIVVGENVYHYHQEGLPFLKAAIKGTREVAVPVTFSILTNIVAFMPIYFVPGHIGKIFKMIPVVVCTVFLISLVESLLVLPAHLGHQRDRQRRGIAGWLHGKQQTFSHWFTRWVRNRYGPFLLSTLRHRYLTVATALGILIIMMAYALSGRMGFQLFPIIESDYAEASLVLPYGSPVEKTEAIMRRLEGGAQQVIDACGRPELVKSVISDVGRTGTHTGRVRVELAEPDIRKEIMSTDEFTQRWREIVGEVPGVEYLRFASDAGGPGSRGRPLTIELSHRNIEVLEESSREVADLIATYPGVDDVDDGFQPGKQQLDFTLKPEGKSLGLTALEVARQVRHAFYGAEVLRQQRGRNEIKIMVRLPEEQRSTEQTLHDMLIRTPGSTYVPFREIAEVKRGRAYTTIDRRNGRRVVQVSGDVTPRSRAGEVLADLRENELPKYLKRHPGLSYSFEGHQADISESMGSLKVTFVLAMLAIYAMLAIPFRSYTQPFVVMLSIPFGVVGAFLGHIIMGYDLCIPSMFGIVALSGVVVNDSLVMIDFANQRERLAGLSHHDAIHSAAIQRFRPIMLTTLTTFGGLAPMIFETSRQARFLIPMALSLGFGILFATLITLVIVPSMYLLVDDVRYKGAAAWRVVFPEPRRLPAQVPEKAGDSVP
jgi:multidrug efflux pump subunit AcrB